MEAVVVEELEAGGGGGVRPFSRQFCLITNSTKSFFSTQDLVLTFLFTRYLCRSLTRNVIRFSRTGGFDNRILHLLQVLEFKAEEPRRPEGASRVTQLPQKFDLHSEHNFFRLNRVNLVWQISQNMVVDDSGVESVPDEGFTELLDCLVPQNPVLPIEGLQLAPEPPLTKLFNQSPATSSGVVAWLELAELDLLALWGPPGGVLELPPEGVDASDLEVLDEGWSEP